MNIFCKECLEFTVERNSVPESSKTVLILRVSSDYNGYAHKQQLYINEKSLATDLENLWKSIKTKKLLRMGVGFSEIDYYDNEVDVYYTPTAKIERGLRRAKIGESSHGAIPKDWSSDFFAKFDETSTVGPIIEVLKKTLGSLFTPRMEKEFIKVIRPVLQKKKNYLHYHIEDEE